MKKSKFAIVIALGLVLCLLCGVTTTFFMVQPSSNRIGRLSRVERSVQNQQRSEHQNKNR